MQCPFCQEEVGNDDDLQIHCLVCRSAYAEPSTSRAPTADCVVVRFRWVKSRPCFEREVHLISSLAGSVTLRWKEDEALYESDTVGVPTGEHICQLAVGGDVVPTEPFEVNQDSDVIFIIIGEVNFQSYPTFDSEFSDRRAAINPAGHIGSDEEPADDRHQPPLDIESRGEQTSNGMSPLYRELLQHQLSHGEPSWVPGSGVQSPVMSETDLSALAGQQHDELRILDTQTDHREELPPGLDSESRPADLSGESDGVPSLPDGGEDDDMSDNESEDVMPQTSSFSPVPSSHSEHDSRVSRNSPSNSVLSEASARDDSVISPLIVEAILRESPPPITGGPSAEVENTPVRPSRSSQFAPGRDLESAEETNNLPEIHHTEHMQSGSRTSPVGSVLDAVTVPMNSEPDALLSDHGATTPPQRHSPAGSVHSSSLFSSGLPSPIMSPRGRSQSDTGVPLISRGSPPGSLHTQIQLPLRPQSLGGSVSTTAGLLTTLGSPRGPISGAEESPISPGHRESPTGSTHSNTIRPQGGTGIVDLPQQQDASRLSSQGTTPVLSAHSGSSAALVGQSGSSQWNHQASEHSTPSAHSPRHRTSSPGSPTELLMEIAHRRGTPPVSSHVGSTIHTPPVLPSTGHRESEHSIPLASMHRTSGTGSPRKLLVETNHRRDTPPVSSHIGSMTPTPTILPSTGDRESGHITPLANMHRTSGTGSPRELLVETTHSRDTPPVSSLVGPTAPTPPVLPSTGHRESEHITPLANMHRTSGTGHRRELLGETTHRRDTPPVSSHVGSRTHTPPVLPSTGHREGEHSTPLTDSPRIRTSGTGSPREELVETTHRRDTPPVSSCTGPMTPTPPVLPSESHRESEHRTPLTDSPRIRTSGTGSPRELLVETTHRRDTPPVSSCTGPMTPTPPVLPSESHRESEHRTPLTDSPRIRTSGTGSPTELLMETAHRQGAPLVPSPMVTSPVVPSTSSQLHHRDSENSAPPVHSPRHRTPQFESLAEFLIETPHAGVASTTTPSLLPTRGSRLEHHKSGHNTSLAHIPKHRTQGSGSPTERPTEPSQGSSSRASRGQSAASSVQSPPRFFSPPLHRESDIPSYGSAFAAVTVERGLPSEVEVLRQERDTLARELRQRAAHYESELRRVKSRNADLEQQMLSIETVATLTKQDDDKTQALEQTVKDLNTTLQEKDQQIRALQESVRDMERTNQQLKDEQESLKTVNELRLEDINRLNSDLQQQVSDLRLRSLELTRAQRGRDEGKIIELQVIQNTLEQHVKRLELKNTKLHKQLTQAQQEMDSMKAVTRSSRISRAKSETDLSRKFDKYTSYDKHRYRDLEPVVKAVNFSTRGDTSGLGATQFSALDTNYTRSHNFGVSSPVIMNGYGSTRSDAKRMAVSSYSSVQDKFVHEPVNGRSTVPRHRGGSLGEDSDVSDDLEHAPQPRWRTQSSESSASSVVSWDHDYTAYSPVSSLQQEQHDRGTGRRRRPHSYHGGSLHDVHRTKDDYSSSQRDVTSSPYSQSLRNVGRHSTSSYSTNSPLLTAHQSTSSKLFTKPFAPRSSSDIQLGMEVLVTRSRGQIGRGKVKYVGPLPGRPDMYIGIELRPGQEGKHDGSLDGQRLFSCKPNRGIFVSFNKVVMCYG